MVDLLKRSLAPLTDSTWKEIDETAARVLKSQLTARRIVDFQGPLGWDFAAVNLGRLDPSDKPAPYEVPWGMRKILPLLETRVPCVLDQMELDSIARNAKDADLGPLEEAARRIALFEESAVYNGFEDGGIEGIISKSEHEAVPLPESARDFPEAVAKAVQIMTVAGVEGPFVLVLGTEAWTGMMHNCCDNCAPQRVIREVTGGDIHMSPAVEGGVLVAKSDGYYELTVGQDFSVGYVGHDRDKVELYLAESFTFRVLDPKGSVRLRPA